MTVSFHLQCFFARCHSHCYDCEFPPLLPIAVTMSLHLHYGYLSVFIKLSFHFHCYCPDVTVIAMAMSFHLTVATCHLTVFITLSFQLRCNYLSANSDACVAYSPGAKTQEAMEAERDQPIVVDLLTKAAVFPTKQGQWVSLSDNPMIADSPELEQMFQMKPGVHFLQLEVTQTGHSKDRHGRGM